MICYVTINDLFLEFDNIHGAKISIIFEICKFYLKNSWKSQLLSLSLSSTDWP